MTFDVLFEDLTEMATREGDTVRVVRLRYPYLLCWFREFYWAGNEIRYKAMGEAVCSPRHLDEFRVTDLKKDWSLWAELDAGQQAELNVRGVIEEEGQPSRKRRSSVITDNTSNEFIIKQEVTVASEVANTEFITKREVTVAAEPEPKRRGRQPNPLNAGIPKKLHCGVCNRDLATTPDQFRAQVQKSGLSQEEFVSSYRCRSCRKEKVTV